MDRFSGGAHTEIKVSVLAQYLGAFTQALKAKEFTLVYIDAFAGSGKYALDVGEGGLLADLVDEQGVVSRPGSAKVAITTKPAFDAIVLIEKHKKSLSALTALKSDFSDRRIKIVEGEANDIVLRLCKGLPWRDIPKMPNGMRSVLFLDPFGVNVNWETVVEIGKTGAVDLWYLLNVEGIGRLLARDFTRITHSSRRRLNRLFGGDWWQAEFYTQIDNQVRLDGEVEIRTTRETPPEHIEQAYIARMKDHYGYVHPTGLRLFKGKKHSFSLIFAVANRSDKAIKAAKDIATWIIDNAGRPKRPAKKAKPTSGQMDLF